MPLYFCVGEKGRLCEKLVSEISGFCSQVGGSTRKLIRNFIF